MHTTTTNGNVNFHADRKIYRQPIICESFIDDDGNENYILDNGNTTLASRYLELWKPIKTAVQWKSKGDNPDRTKIPY